MFAHLSGEQLPPPCLGGFRQPPAALRGRPVGHRCLHKVSVLGSDVSPTPRRAPLSSVGDCCSSLIGATRSLSAHLAKAFRFVFQPLLIVGKRG